MNICTCLNCMEEFEDKNPGEHSKDYLEENLRSLVMGPSKEEGNWNICWICRNCRTDDYLVDNKYKDR